MLEEGVLLDAKISHLLDVGDDPGDEVAEKEADGPAATADAGRCGEAFAVVVAVVAAAA